MNYDEWLLWQRYFDDNPPGWEEDYRSGMIIQTLSGVFGGKSPPITDMFPSLKKIYNSKENASTVPDKVIPSGRVLQFMETALGGDGSGWSLSKLQEETNG